MGKENKLTKSIGKKIKLARAKCNITQEALAEKTGLSPRYISQLERGLAFGTVNTVVSICNELNIDSNFLFEDVIKSKHATSSLTELVDEHFLESYIKLNTVNKQFVDLIVRQLLILQDDKDEKKSETKKKKAK